jgi:hypothetical protein
VTDNFVDLYSPETSLLKVLATPDNCAGLAYLSISEKSIVKELPKGILIVLVSFPVKLSFLVTESYFTVAVQEDRVST